MKDFTKTIPLTFQKSDDTDAPMLRASLTSFGGDGDVVGDIIEPGALDDWMKSNGGRDLPMLREHNTNNLIGAWSNLAIEGDKMFADGVIDTDDTQLAGETLRQIKRGRIDGVSIGFGADWDDYEMIDDDPFESGNWGIRFHKIHLYEASVVLFPANPQAGIQKSRQALIKERGLSAEQIAGIIRSKL